MFLSFEIGSYTGKTKERQAQQQVQMQKNLKAITTDREAVAKAAEENLRLEAKVTDLEKHIAQKEFTDSRCLDDTDVGRLRDLWD